MTSNRDIANAVDAFQAGGGDYDNDRVILDACSDRDIDPHTAPASVVCAAVKRYLSSRYEE